MTENESRPSFASYLLRELEAMPHADAVDYAMRLGDPDTFGSRLQRVHGYAPSAEEDLAAVVALLRELHGYGEGFTADRLKAILDTAHRRQLEPLHDQELAQRLAPASPRWPSGVIRLDQRTGGGFYGVTCLAGFAKLGKSLLALASAVEAALAGWLVIYFNAEVTEPEMANRVLRYCGGNPKAELAERLQIVTVSPNVVLADFVRRIVQGLDMETERVLVVVDSINRVATYMQDHSTGFGYFDGLHRIAEYAMVVRRETLGAVSWLLVSETNRGGQVKGATLEYMADLVLRMRPGKEPTQVELTLAEARESAGGALGLYERRWQTGTFDPWSSGERTWDS
jgi:KaiC/GvpD/RAD55 family RecA-like ATPase